MDPCFERTVGLVKQWGCIIKNSESASLTLIIVHFGETVFTLLNKLNMVDCTCVIKGV